MYVTPGQIALQPSTMTMLSDSSASLVPWHPSFIDTTVQDIAAQSCLSVSPSSQALLTLMLRELFLSLFHINSILSALAGNTPSLPLSPSAALMLVVYVDVRACADSYYKSLNSLERETCVLEEIIREAHMLFGPLKRCALRYIEKFATSVAGELVHVGVGN
jgi:hypothetical protein